MSKPLSLLEAQILALFLVADASTIASSLALLLLALSLFCYVYMQGRDLRFRRMPGEVTTGDTLCVEVT